MGQKTLPKAIKMLLVSLVAGMRMKTSSTATMMMIQPTRMMSATTWDCATVRLQRVKLPSFWCRGERNEQSTGGNSNGNSSTKTCQAAFCTQRCLLMINNDQLLNFACQNVVLHRKGSYLSQCCGRKSGGIGSYSLSLFHNPNHHGVHHHSLLQLLKWQLEGLLSDRGIHSLHRHGWSGALFCVTPYSYGYTGH
jgi:hypothetical protein